MSDTQWPRYEVFQQEREGQPHRNVGSVHAVDSEMALQNARDVFVRRPQTVNLWVAPANEILAKSKEEIDSETVQPEADLKSEGSTESYVVFRKTTQRQSMTYVIYTGKVMARSPIDALVQAIDRFGDRETYVWWVCPDRAIVKSGEDDIENMFEQAHDKTYRMPKNYRLVSEMMQLKRGKD